MKKCINIAFVYAVAALCMGVFYREFTKILGFTGRTTLAFGHAHLFGLGTLLFLILAVFCKMTNLEEQKQYKKFMIFYNIGLPFMVVMFIVRGVLQVLGTELTRGADASVSGIAGIAHIIITVGIVFMFLALKKTAEKA